LQSVGFADFYKDLLSDFLQGVSPEIDRGSIERRPSGPF
jgi:hypothetical protein